MPYPSPLDYPPRPSEPATRQAFPLDPAPRPSTANRINNLGQFGGGTKRKSTDRRGNMRHLVEIPGANRYAAGTLLALRCGRGTKDRLQFCSVR